MRIGVANTRALVLYEDVLFIHAGNLIMNPILKISSEHGYLGDHYDYGMFRVRRYFRISPTGNWILEVSFASKMLFIRPIFGRVMKPTLAIRAYLPESGPVTVLGDVVVPFTYESKGIIRFWTCKMDLQPPSNFKIKEKRILVLELFTWNKITEEKKSTGISYQLFNLPKTGFTAKWKKTDFWVILCMGNLAYVFDHEGAKAREKPIEMPPAKSVATDGDISILTARGFEKSVWFLAGNIKNEKKVVYQAVVWDGALSAYDFEFPMPIIMANACATGRRNSRPSGRDLISIEIIISALDKTSDWYHLRYLPETKKIREEIFFECKDPGVLCPVPDYVGRVYFSRDLILFVYSPYWGIEEKFSSLLDVTFNENFPVRPEHDRIFAIQVGFRKVWVATSCMFYRLDQLIRQQIGVIETPLPVKPVVSFDLESFRRQFQVPGVIRTYPEYIDREESSAIMENHNYMWVSSRPMVLYAKTDLLDPAMNPSVVLLEKGRMLVLSTKIEKGDDSGTKRVSSVICEALI